MRVGEIAALSLDDVLDASGRLDRDITIWSTKSKSRYTRRIPMHPDVRNAIVRFRKCYPTTFVFMFSTRKPKIALTSNALTVWFWETYQKAGFNGCSSHSGRRTCLTEMAQRVAHFGHTLRDVQKFAGHQRLDTTEGYIEASGSVRAMVNSLGVSRGAELPEQLEEDIYQTWYRPVPSAPDADGHLS
jgi:integrase